MQELDYQLQKITDELSKLNSASPENSLDSKFSELKEVVMEESRFGSKESFKTLGIMAIGGAVSPVVSNIVNKFIPVGSLGAAVGALGLRFIIKNRTVQNFADGMIIASLSQFVANLLQGKIGFSEGGNDDEFAFSEQRVGAVNFG